MKKLNEKELERISIYLQIEMGKISIKEGAGILCLSIRQMQKIQKRYREERGKNALVKWFNLMVAIMSGLKVSPNNG